MRRDSGVTEWVRETIPEWLEFVFSVITYLGDWWLVVPLLALLYLADVYWTLSGASSTGEAENGTDSSLPENLCSPATVAFIAMVFGGLVLTLAIKAGIGAGRPPEAWHADGLSEVSDEGFPSGHVMVATIFWGGLAVWYRIGPKSWRYAGATSIILVVAASRVALGVHFVTDVIVAIGVGVGYVALTAYLLRDRPAIAFLLAFGVGIVTTLVSGGEARSLLGLGGIVAAAIGWRVVELQPVRTLLQRRLGPLLSRPNRFQERI